MRHRGETIAGPFEHLLADAPLSVKRAVRVAVRKHKTGEEAHGLLRPLAEQGDATAQYFLGIEWWHGHFEGDCYRRDLLEAAKWFRLAAERGLAKAQYNLGGIYGRGEGVPQDYVLAHFWSNLAVSRAPASEAKVRDEAVKNRDLAASKMTPAQIAEAQKLAREWKPKPATQ